jgi:hypothetical protein
MQQQRVCSRKWELEIRTWMRSFVNRWVQEATERYFPRVKSISVLPTVRDVAHSIGKRRGNINYRTDVAAVDVLRQYTGFNRFRDFTLPSRIPTWERRSPLTLLSRTRSKFSPNLRENQALVRFQVLTTTRMKMRAFLDIASYSLVGVDRRFRGAYCLHQGDETSVYSNETTRRYISSYSPPW